MKDILFLATVWLMSQHLFSQEIIKINSEYINNETPILVQKPSDYSQSKKYPVAYMLHGYSENYTQWSKTTDLQKLANDYQMILVCPEGFTTYYLNGTGGRPQYEHFFFDELVPLVHRKYKVDSKNIFITGLSMGGYGALSLFIKHPEYFNTAASTSGALEIDFENFKNISNLFFENERMTNDLKHHLGNPSDNDWNRFSISNLLEQHPDFKKGFFLDCGLQDPLLENTLKIKELALSKELPIRFAIQRGGHNTEYWSQSIVYHFVYFKQHLNQDEL
ncbi:alpha/beta hydrolase [Allomuricauda sp. XS_ASV26]|uniref:alpha/beta hydrolase n=1 Tax=Allomuricauda sp. XS_ASV26 TaxID=3241292 RepID=UPI00351131A9